MNQSFDKEFATREESILYPPPDLSLPSPVTTTPTSDFAAMQSSIGNAALANTDPSDSPALSSSASQLQSTYGNAALANAGQL